MGMVISLLTVCLVGAVLALDRTAFMQTMVSRPLVAGPLVGLALGQAHVGLAAGVVLELLWVNRLAMGGVNPPNACLAAVVVTGAAILAQRILPSPVTTRLGVALLVSLPLAELAGRLESRMRGLNAHLARRARREIQAGHPQWLWRLNLAGLAFSFLFAFGFLLVCLPTVTAVTALVAAFLPPFLVRAVDFLLLFLPLVGLGILLSTVNIKHPVRIFAAVFFLAVGLVFLV